MAYFVNILYFFPFQMRIFKVKFLSHPQNCWDVAFMMMMMMIVGQRYHLYVAYFKAPLGPPF